MHSVNICMQHICVSLDVLWDVFRSRSVYILDTRSLGIRIVFCRLGFAIKGDNLVGSEWKLRLHLGYVYINQTFISVDVIYNVF